MNRKFLYIIGLSLVLSITNCTDMLELEPLDKVSSEQLLSSQGGIKTLLARIYNRMPVEDFNYVPNSGFNRRGWSGIGGSILMTSFYTDESYRSDGTGIGPVTNHYWPYDDIREVNLFFESLEQVKETMRESQYLQLKSEAHFIRAYMYFALAKRYGGVPIIDRVLDSEYVPGSDNSNLYIPRSTEKATWEFILNECDLAIENLPETLSSEDGIYRASKWAAYGLKSRAALFAASVAKYWENAPLTGEAVNQNLVGMNSSDASFFYQACLDASATIINNSGKSLYMPNPATPQDAANNFYNLFLTDNNEILFKKHFLDGTVVANQGHSFDVFYNPAQTNPGFHKFGRFNPTLDIVDIFENYTDNGLGESAKIITREDGNEDYTIANPTEIDINLPFKKYDNLIDPFLDKDARMWASIIVPGSDWKGVRIIIQGGLIKSTGEKLIYTDGSATGLDGNTYYSYGGEGITSYSGFRGLGQGDDANYTSSGFSIKKYLREGVSVIGQMESSDTDWIDIRLAEIYLNYAEATVESGQGDLTLAAKLINDLRRRAGHQDNIPLTLENVLKERRIELAFEGKRYWDLVRRRDFHQLFAQTRRKALIPILDLRDENPKYIFVRANNYNDENAGGRTFQPYMYYLPIPGRNTNDLVENPQY